MSTDAELAFLRDNRVGVVREGFLGGGWNVHNHLLSFRSRSFSFLLLPCYSRCGAFMYWHLGGTAGALLAGDSIIWVV